MNSSSFLHSFAELAVVRRAWLATAAVLSDVAAALPAHARPRDMHLERLLHHDRGTVLIASHRAGWSKASENSLDGIRACIADSVDMVEIDLRTTRDGALVLMHDETVDRTTDGHGAVADLTLAELHGLRLREQGGGAAAALTERRIPIFAEALTAARGRILMTIDVKAAALDRIIDAVAAARAARTVVLNVPIDVDPAIMRRAHKLGIATQPVYIERQSTLPATIALHRVVALRPTSIQLIVDNPAILNDADHAAVGMRLFVNTTTFDIATGRPMNLAGPFLDARALDDPDAVWGVPIARGVTISRPTSPGGLRPGCTQNGLR